MITELCETILTEPRAVDIKTLIEEVKRKGPLDLSLQDRKVINDVIENPKVIEEYSDLLDELAGVILFEG